jgi:hypothetical protein
VIRMLILLINYKMFQLIRIVNQQNQMKSSTCVKSAIQRRWLSLLQFTTLFIVLNTELY